MVQSKITKKILYSEEVYEFLAGLTDKVRKKVLYDISKVAGGVVDNELFKKLGDTDIWEFRTFYDGIWSRILAFWDTESEALIVTTHGFCKKSARTPKKEIDKAIAIKNEYFRQKRENSR